MISSLVENTKISNVVFMAALLPAIVALAFAVTLLMGQYRTVYTLDAIEAVKVIIRRLSESSEEIANTMNQQNEATVEISRSVQVAASGTSEVSSNISEVNTAANDSKVASNDVLQMAQKLSTHTQEVKTQIEKFLNEIRAA